MSVGKGTKRMEKKEMLEYIEHIGRCELYDELEYMRDKKYSMMRKFYRIPYPRYLKAIRVSLVELGYDEEWVDTEFRHALEKKYLVRHRKIKSVEELPEEFKNYGKPVQNQIKNIENNL